METGHAKNVSNHETLIIACKSFGTSYNPSNKNLDIPALTTQQDEAKGALKNLKTAEVPLKKAEAQRKIVFKNLKTTATKIMNAIKAASVPAPIIANAETINRKIQGKRADNSPIVTPTGETPKNRNSVSQQSYDMLIDNFDKLIELLIAEPLYTPNEEHLKVVTLTAYLNELKAANLAKKIAEKPYKKAMETRDAILYAPETGLYDTVLKVKNYVSSVFGSTSPEYKEVSKLVFTKP